MARIGSITFACAEPVHLAAFWQAALGYVPQEVPAPVQEAVDRAVAAGELDATAWAALVPPDGTGPRLLFQRRPRSETESIPIHLDIVADDRAAEVARLSERGATVVGERSETIGPLTQTWTVMRDPEGNGFCVHGP